MKPAALTYDDGCALCIAVARFLRWLDRSGVEFVPLSDLGRVEALVGPFFAPAPVPFMFHLRVGDELVYGATAVPAILRRVLWRPRRTLKPPWRR